MVNLVHHINNSHNKSHREFFFSGLPNTDDLVLLIIRKRQTYTINGMYIDILDQFNTKANQEILILHQQAFNECKIFYLNMQRSEAYYANSLF